MRRLFLIAATVLLVASAGCGGSSSSNGVVNVTVWHGYEDIEGILLDRDTWSAANASSPLMPICPAAQDVLATDFRRVPTLNNSDPPRHGPMRKSVLAVMTPRRLNALEPTLRQFAENLVKAFEGEPVVDLVEAFAFVTISELAPGRIGPGALRCSAVGRALASATALCAH